MFRSQSIGFYEIIIPRQAAWETMNLLGRLQQVHIAQNQQTNKPFYKQIKNYEQSLQIIRKLGQILEKKSFNMHMTKRTKDQYEKIFQYWQELNKSNCKDFKIQKIQQQIEYLWEKYINMNKRMENLKIKKNHHQENIALLKANQFFINQQNVQKSHHEPQHQISFHSSYPHLQDKLPFKFQCGILKKSQQNRFQRTMFRISRGNVYTDFVDVHDIYQSKNKQLIEKCIFIVIYPCYKQASYLENKIKKLIQSYNSKTLQWIKKKQSITYAQQKQKKQLEESTSLLKLFEQQQKNYLNQLLENRIKDFPFTRIEILYIFILREIQIYRNLNNMILYNNFIQGKLYISDKKVEYICQALQALQKTNLPAPQIIKRSSKIYPTYFKLNQFTKNSQIIVDTYGIPRYQQINPALFNIITFPFLFGIMFGDIGHGAILFCFGLFLCFKKQFSFQIFTLLSQYKYLITLMGFFSLYCGFIYNEYLSINLNLFGSCYNPNQINSGDIIPQKEDCVYPFGIDPVWGISIDGTTFINSLKMKLSVIIAIVHMTFGIILKGFNSIYFKNYLDFFFQFIPEIIFILVLFGYMDFLIIYKWLKNWGSDIYNSPSIITTMINLPLNMGKTQDCCGGEPMWGTYGNTSQDNIQYTILMVAILCIFVILLPKPLLLYYQMKKRNQQLLKLQTQQQQLESKDQQLLNKNEYLDRIEQDEIFVNQIIETIEYVLGSISSTASYLRLWALSLAHSELSQVFFKQTVQNSISSGYPGIPSMLISFIFFAFSTFLVFLFMDIMECFLHSLRLHWVQFQNKFYKGDGFYYNNFSFVKIMQENSFKKK